MAPLRLQILWLICGWLMITVIVILSLIPISQAGPSDKLNHLIAYFALMAWFGALYPRRQHFYVLAGLILLGIVLEGLQGLTAYRQMSLADIVANTAGAVLACLLVRGSIRRVLGWFEIRVLRQTA